MIKGYKGFNKGLICRDKQYAENTTFKEDSATLCENGMHFCEHPFDVLNYYPCYNNKKKEFSEYAEVLAPEEATAKGENKTVTKELKIGARISFDKLIKLGVDFNLSKVKYNKDNKATGSYSGASTTGNYSGASTTGDCSGAMAVGTKVQAKCTNNSVAMAVGEGSMAKGGIGCYIVMTECLWDEEKEIYKIIDCKCFKVDGKIIKADAFYKLVDGKPFEVE